MTTAAFDAAWAEARSREVVAAVAALVARHAASPAQLGLLQAAAAGLRAARAPADDLLPSVHLPLLVVAHVAGEEAGALPVAVLAAVLELCMDLTDAVDDEEVEERWPGLDRRTAGLATMLFAGPILYRAIAPLAGPGGAGQALLEAMSEELLAIAHGQAMDLALRHADAPAPEAAATSVALKTGRRRALYAVLAARAAGAPPAVEQDCAAFGMALGQAYQLANDLGGLFAPDGPSRDLLAGARTWPIAWAIARATEAERPRLLAALAAARHDPALHPPLQAVLRDRGVLLRTRLEIAVHRAAALSALDRLAPRPAVRQALEAMVARDW